MRVFMVFFFGNSPNCYVVTSCALSVVWGFFVLFFKQRDPSDFVFSNSYTWVTVKLIVL